MAKIGINTGSAPNQGDGSTLLQGAIAINNNFDEIYSAIGDGNTVSDISLTFSSASGLGTLTYSNRTLNYTPPDLVGFTTSGDLVGFTTSGDLVGFVTTGGSGSTLTGIVTSIIAGTNITIVPENGTGSVTINSSGSGGGSLSIQDEGISVGTAATIINCQPQK